IMANLTRFARDGSAYSMNYLPPVVGEYRIYCNAGGSSEKVAFTIRDLEFDILKAPNTVYSDEKMGIELRLRSLPDGENINSGVRLRLLASGQEIAIADPYFYVDRWHVQSEGSLAKGNYTMEVEAEYQGRVVRKTFAAAVIQPLEFSANPADTEAVGGRQMELKLTATDHGQGIAKKEDMRVTVGGQNIDFSLDSDRVRFTLPQLPYGSQSLEVTLAYNSTTLVSTNSLDYVVQVAGDLVGAVGKQVAADLLFSNAGYTKLVKVRDGGYSATLRPGTYDLLVTFGKAKVNFTAVQANRDLSNFIRVDAVESANIDGLKTMAGVAVEMAAVFNKAHIEFEYNPSGIVNESDISVLRCRDWNIDTGRCGSSWENANAEIDLVRNRAKLTTTETAAFIVGEKRSLEIEVKTDKSNYFSSDTVNVLGIIRSFGDFVGEADVEVAIGSQSRRVKASGSGVFSAIIQAPDEAGSHPIMVTATKNNYKGAQKALEITVEKRIDLSIVVPESANINVNSTTEMEVSVINTGQVEVNDIGISVSGMPDGWYEYSTHSIASLAPGEERRIALSITPRPHEKSVFTVVVTANGEGVSREQSFVFAVRNAVPTEQPTAASDAGLSGMLLSGSQDVVNALLIICIAIVAFLIIRNAKSERAFGSAQAFSQPGVQKVVQPFQSVQANQQLPWLKDVMLQPQPARPTTGRKAG
ncbi:MAG: hypothetical protein HY519_00580, partial [Candidatus Aenigmarchaeota archaeon]|nr:hypothetical protein [Candidatus Aenigmarchaeota archaeon]